MLVLVTRPEPDAAELVARLAQLGHQALVDPLLTVAWLTPPLGNQDRFQATLATSRNALRGLARHPEGMTHLLGRPLLAVGPATAALARDLGFRQVEEGPGTARGLADLVHTRLQPSVGPLLFLAGAVTTLDLGAVLAAPGFAVETAVVYRMVPAPHLQPATLAAVEAHRIGAVTLLSARTAATYATLIEAGCHLECLSKTPHLCLSASVAEPLRTLPLERLVIARKPNLEELLALVGGPAKCLP